MSPGGHLSWWRWGWYSTSGSYRRTWHQVITHTWWHVYLSTVLRTSLCSIPNMQAFSLCFALTCYRPAPIVFSLVVDPVLDYHCFCLHPNKFMFTPVLRRDSHSEGKSPTHGLFPLIIYAARSFAIGLPVPELCELLRQNTVSGASIVGVLYMGGGSALLNFAREVEASLTLLGQHYSVVSAGEVLNYVPPPPET